MMKLRDDIDQSRIRWGKPRDPVSFTCSWCGRDIDPRECPLRLMGRRYAVFCDGCVGLVFK